jgi:carboxylesterase type B
MAYWYLFALAAILFQRVTAWVVGQEVKTTGGVYLGHASKIRPEVSEYLGMRFGQETSGDRRFARPVKFTSTEFFKADTFSDDCPGVLTNATGALAAIGDIILQQNGKASEDCLTINLWTKPQTGDKAKAVLLWMYGGGFNIGTSNTPLYDGSRFVEEQDVILVRLLARIPDRSTVDGVYLGNLQLPPGYIWLPWRT